ncbi:MAG: PDZ domain-containing protein [Gemmatimonadetes bacterium]|nr:PDZ domain-containing protein [Gemmatimonadota bacterium]
MRGTLHALVLALATTLAAAPTLAQVVPPPPPPPEPRGWIGISYDSEKVQEGLRVRGMSRVVEVREGGPAAGAGVRVGDILVSINGRPWEEEFGKGAPRLRPGDEVRLVVERGGQRQEISLVAGRWPVEMVVPSELEKLKVTMMPDSVVERLYLAMDSLRVRIIEDEGLRYRVAELEVAADSILDDLERYRVVRLPRRSGERTVFVVPATPAPPVTPGALIPSPPFRVWGFADSVHDSVRVVTELGVPFARSTGEQRADVLEFRPTVPYVLGENRAAGAEVVELRPELAGYFGVERGVLVVDVTAGTPAARAGLAPGDVLTHVGGSQIGSVADLRRGLLSRGGDELALTLIRKGRTIQLALKR